METCDGGIPKTHQAGSHKCLVCGREYQDASSLANHQRCHSAQKTYSCDQCEFQTDVSHKLTKHHHKHDVTTFSCDVCSAVFKWKGDLSSHMKRHVGDELHVCDVCGHKCLSRSLLIRHKDTHSNENAYRCVECGKSFKHKQSFNQHFKLHSGIGLHACQLCHKVFLSSTTLKNHMDSHSDTSKYKCQTCGKQFKLRATLNYHKRIHTRKNIHVCSYCGKEFVHASELNKHLECHEGTANNECDICGKKYQHKRALARHRKVVHCGKDVYDCEVCHKKFASPSSLRYHMDSHATSSQYTCEVCNESFRRRRALQYHQRIHRGMGMLKCPVCDQTFYTQSNFKSHQRTHVHEYLPCSICQKTYKNVRALERHKQEVHENDGRQKHTCNMCGRTYKTKSALTQHTRLHTGRQLLTCNICDRKFVKASEMKKHHNTHSAGTRYGCDICDKTYKYESDLLSHKRVHSSLAFKCEYCDKTFGAKQQLRSHMAVHTQDKPHVCNTCGASFKHEYSLVKHWKRHLYPSATPQATIKAYSEYDRENEQEGTKNRNTESSDDDCVSADDEIITQQRTTRYDQNSSVKVLERGRSDPNDEGGISGRAASVIQTTGGSTTHATDPIVDQSLINDATITEHNPSITIPASSIKAETASHPANCSLCLSLRPAHISPKVCALLHSKGSPVICLDRLTQPSLIGNKTANSGSESITKDDADTGASPYHPRSVSDTKRRPRSVRVPRSVTYMRATDILRKSVKQSSKQMFINRKTRVLRSRGRLVFLHPKDDVEVLTYTPANTPHNTSSGSLSQAQQDTETVAGPEGRTRATTTTRYKRYNETRSSSDMICDDTANTVMQCELTLTPIDSIIPSLRNSPSVDYASLSNHLTVSETQQLDYASQPPLVTEGCPFHSDHNCNSVCDTSVKNDPEHIASGLGHVTEVRSLNRAVSSNTLEELEIKTEDLNDIVSDPDPPNPSELCSLDIKMPPGDLESCILLQIKEETPGHENVGQQNDSRAAGQPDTDIADITTVPDMSQVDQGDISDVQELSGLIELPTGYTVIGVVKFSKDY